ncbi:MAG: hypothetical protein FWB71_00095 [Defluviitaleaceae bacterium]|nr:hypothetical protein [Defluviitaleaceae bacterium]
MWITKLTHKIETLAVRNPLIYRIAARYYTKIIQKEISLAGITENDRILCIGGGICPFSAIMLHQATGARVTVIDNQSACIPHARKVIKRLGISESVHVMCQDGCCANLSLENFNIIHFAVQITPMESVFANAERLALAGTKFLVRQPKNSVNKLVGNTMLYVK